MFFENNSIQVFVNFLTRKINVNKLTKCMILAYLSGKHVPQPSPVFWPIIEFGLTATRFSITKTNIWV